MYRRPNGRFADPKKTTFRENAVTVLTLASLTVMVGYALGYSMPDFAIVRGSENEYHSPIPTTTPATTVTPSLTATPSPIPTATKVEEVRDVVSVEDVKAYIATKPWPVHEALAVAKCESGFYEKAIGDINLPDGGPASYGVYQIRGFANRPAPDALLDYRDNIDYAYQIWSVQGWGPWTCRKVLSH